MIRLLSLLPAMFFLCQEDHKSIPLNNIKFIVDHIIQYNNILQYTFSKPSSHLFIFLWILQIRYDFFKFLFGSFTAINIIEIILLLDLLTLLRIVDRLIIDIPSNRKYNILIDKEVAEITAKSKYKDTIDNIVGTFLLIWKTVKSESWFTT